MTAVATDHDRLRPEPPKTFYEGVVHLPGYGDAPNRCRDLQAVGFCDRGHTILGRSSCGTRYCPDHWRDWNEDAVVNQVARLAAYREAQPMGSERRLSHVVASPPQDRRYSAREMWESRSEAYEALEAAGVPGGAAVTHPYRTNERGDELFQTARDAGDLEDGTGKWQFLRETTEDFEDLSRYIEASPHYHALAAGEDIDGSAAPDGWVVERIDSLKPFHYHDSEAYEDMAARVYYVLTHAGVQDGRQSTTYFGAIHPASFDPEEELTAGKWDRIQREAEKAVKEHPDEQGDGGVSAGPEECPREECEAAVRPLEDLREYLNDDEWMSSVRCTKSGRKRLARLRGVLIWRDGRSDRPPPSAATSKEKMREWLLRLGEGMAPGASSRSGPSQPMTLTEAVTNTGQ